MSDLRPTTRLRWVDRESPTNPSGSVTVRQMLNVRVLQQWFAEDMPSYMRDQAKGEWRDVPTEEKK